MTERSVPPEFSAAAETPQHPPRPRWVKIAGVVAAVVVLVVIAVALFGGGEHGPGRHLPGGDDQGGHTPPAQHGS